jgi:hypothetical protein
MERHGHLRLSVDVRLKLLAISRSTVDRILSLEKDRAGKSISTTKPDRPLRVRLEPPACHALFASSTRGLGKFNTPA